MSKSGIRSFFITLFLVFSCFFNVGSSSFIVEGEAKQENITINDAGGAVCYNKNTGTKYTTINKALESAVSNQEVIVYIGVSVTCEYDLHIPLNITLTIPFFGKCFDSSLSGDNIGDSTLYKISSADDRNNYGNTLGDANSTSVNKYRSILINMRNGADIIVDGVLNLGGACSSYGNNGYYSEINLGLNSSITCNNGSTFNCYGFVKENYDDAVNSGMEGYQSIIDNSRDNGRCFLVNSGATINTSLALYDVLSAGSLTGMIAAEKCPFNVFDFQCIQTYLIFENGAKMYGTVLVEGPNSMVVMKDDICLISSNTSESSLLYLSSGRLCIEYKPNDSRFSSRDTNKNTFNIVVNGNIDIGYLYFSEYAGQIELDTRKFHLPMSSKVTMYVQNNSTLNISKKVKFLMGSKLIINDGGKVNINESVAFYNSQIAPEKNPSLGIYYDSTGKEDAKLVCNGTIKLNSDSSNAGYLGATITHTSTTGSGKVDFTSVSNASYLSAVVEEGTSNTLVTVTSSGLFNDGETCFSAQFLAGNEYNSLSNEINFYWNGVFVSTVTINVTFDTSVFNPVFDYTIMLSEKSDGSSPYTSELTNMKDEGTTAISRGLYLNITINNATSVLIKKNENEILPYNPSTWIYADGNFDIYIIPSEGIKVSLSIYKDATYSDNESKWSQGTGHTYFYIEESSTQDGEYSRTMDLKCSSFDFYVKKANYFKVGYYWDQSDTVISMSGMNGFTANNKITTNDENFLPQPTTTWNNNTTSSCSDPFLAGNSSTAPGLEYKFELGYYSGHAKADESSGPCISEDTLVLMADNTYKRAIDIRSGDMLMTINHETGVFEAAPVVFNDHIDVSENDYNVITLCFSNGKSIDIIYEHGFFDLDTMKYEYITEENYDTFVGHRFVTIDYANGIPEKGEAILNSAILSEKHIKLCSPVTYKNLNIITEGMLSMPGGISGIFNIFDYDEDLSYNAEKKQQDIDTYGLFDYSYFEDRIPYEFYEAFNGLYLKVAIGKGILTEDMINYYINRYLPIVNEQNNGE